MHKESEPACLRGRGHVVWRPGGAPVADPDNWPDLFEQTTCLCPYIRAASAQTKTPDLTRPSRSSLDDFPRSTCLQPTDQQAMKISGAYAFGYNENHGTGGTSRWESGDGVGNKKGSYSLRGADGRWRTVQYVADGAGFRASVKTNEPGTAPSSPASAGINAPVLHVAGNYDFGYKERHPGGSSFRQETGNPWGHKVGAYGIADSDGRVRLVKYVADANGFRVHIATNEPGTAPSSPAAVGINAPVALPVPVEPLVLAPTAAVGVSPGTAAHVYGPAIEQAVFKPAYAKKPFLATHAAPAPLEVEYDTRGNRHW
ncbi:hypothetical protein HPB48_017238 [Haemaphysalis longicornis]|uniref:Cuticular protein n=1 Tax=Haemaphysalis longicornis TaxID=44386 RepID=A0A9J6H237_HAELO|nr:hypothetical protein HPB48_017238 [Haemaphysalis longicornis]